MNRVFEAAWQVEQFCRAQGFRFCFIGGIALQRWGEPRMTVDAGLTVLSGFGGEVPYVDAFLEAFEPRLAQARQFALRNRVLLLKRPQGVRIDAALGAMPFEEGAVGRATPFFIEENRSLTTCLAENLIVHKAFANREQDWVDIKGILVRQAGRVNACQILSDLKPLVALKEEPDTLRHLAALLRECGSLD